MPKTFIFFGRSGSGKGTQAKLLIDYLNKENRKTLYIETGEQFRQFLHDDNFTARLTSEIMKSGSLLPSFLPVWLWSRDLIEQYTGAEDLILDGLARRLEEAPLLDSALKFYKQKKPIVIFMNTSSGWSFDRMKHRGRSDDSDEYIKSRLAWFDTSVVPAMNFFKNNPEYQFVAINGEQTINVVHKDIISSIAPYL